MLRVRVDDRSQHPVERLALQCRGEALLAQFHPLHIVGPGESATRPSQVVALPIWRHEDHSDTVLHLISSISFSFAPNSASGSIVIVDLAPTEDVEWT